MLGPTAQHDDIPRHDDPTEFEPRPWRAPERGPGATLAQLHSDIDSGATGNKVLVIGSALRLLGANAEAASAPPS